MSPEIAIEQVEMEALMLIGSADGTPSVEDDDVIFNGIDDPFTGVVGSRSLESIFLGN